MLRLARVVEHSFGVKGGPGSSGRKQPPASRGAGSLGPVPLLTRGFDRVRLPALAVGRVSDRHPERGQLVAQAVRRGEILRRARLLASLAQGGRARRKRSL